MTTFGVAPAKEAADPGESPPSAPAAGTAAADRLEGAARGLSVDVFDDRTEPPPLETAEVHLWFVDLHVPPGSLSHFFSLLSRDERERAERFRFDAHRRRYIARRGVLRWLLSRYLDRPGSTLSFGYGPAGKPFLAADHQPDGDPERHLSFNLSDSEDVALYAIGRGVELGVDVEHLREMPDAQSIASYSFSRREQDALAALPEDLTSLGFFHGWTRKEAYVKATGQGLGAPLADFTVSLGPGLPAAFLGFDNGLDEVAAWALYHLAPDSGHVGALAVRRHGLQPRGFRWRPPY